MDPSLSWPHGVAAAVSLLAGFFLWQWCIAWFIRRLLGTVCKSVDAIQLKLLEGSLFIRGLDIQPRLLDGFNIPLAPSGAFVETVKISFPWAHLRSRPFRIQASGLRLSVDLRSFPKAHTRGRPKPKRPGAMREAVLASVEAVLLGHTAPRQEARESSRRGPSGGISARVAESVALWAARGTEVSIAETVITLELGRPGLLESVAGLDEDSESAGLVPCVELQIGAIRWVSGQEVSSWGGRLDSKLHLEGVLCSVLRRAPTTPAHNSHPAGVGSAGAHPQGASRKKERRRVLLRRWNGQVGVQWKPGPRAARGGAGAPAASLAVSIQAGALLLVADRFVLGVALAASKSILEFTQFSRDRSDRPAVSVSACPRAWWRHAAACVTRRMRAASGLAGELWADAAGGPHLKLSHLERCRLRREYKASLKAFLSPRGFLRRRRSPAAAWRTHADLEARLPLSDVCACRWWSLLWGSSSFSSSSSSSPAAHSLLPRLSRLLDGLRPRLERHLVASTKGHSRLPVSLTAACPKAELSLLEGSRQRAPLLQASTGSLTADFTLSGLSCFSASLSIASVHVASFVPAPFSDWDNSRAAEPPRREAVLLKSPAGGAQQSWVEVQLAEAPDPADPPVCTVDMAPVDVVCVPQHLVQASEFVSSVTSHKPLALFLQGRSTEGTPGDLRLGTTARRAPPETAGLGLSLVLRLCGLRALLPCDAEAQGTWDQEGHGGMKPQGGKQFAINLSDMTVELSSSRQLELEESGEEESGSGAQGKAPSDETETENFPMGPPPDDETVGDSGSEPSTSPSHSAAGRRCGALGGWMRKVAGAHSFRHLKADFHLEASLLLPAQSKRMRVLDGLPVHLELQSAAVGAAPDARPLVHASASTGDVGVQVSPLIACSLVCLGDQLGGLLRRLRGASAARRPPRKPREGPSGSRGTVSLQLQVPRVVASLVGSQPSAAAHPEELLSVRLIDNVASVAVDNKGSELRFSVGSSAVVMPGPPSQSSRRPPGGDSSSSSPVTLLAPIPMSVRSVFVSRRGQLKRAFAAWRVAASGSVRGGDRRDGGGGVRQLQSHLLTSNQDSQLSGVVGLSVNSSGTRRALAVVDSSLLVVNLNTEVVQRIQGFAQSLSRLAQEEAALRPSRPPPWPRPDHYAAAPPGSSEASGAIEGGMVFRPPSPPPNRSRSGSRLQSQSAPAQAALPVCLKLCLSSLYCKAQTQGQPVFSVSLDDIMATIRASVVPPGEPGEGRRATTAHLTAHGLLVRDLLCPNPWFSTVLEPLGSHADSSTGARLSLWLETVWEAAGGRGPGTRCSSESGSAAGPSPAWPSSTGTSVDGSAETADYYSHGAQQQQQQQPDASCRAVVRISLDDARAVVLTRFIHDAVHVVRSFSQMAASLRGAARSVTDTYVRLSEPAHPSLPSLSEAGSFNKAAERQQAASDTPPPTPRRAGLPPWIQATLSRILVDVPRSSLSSDYYTVALSYCEVLLPVSSSGVAVYRNSQSRPPASALDRLMKQTQGGGGGGGGVSLASSPARPPVVPGDDPTAASTAAGGRRPPHQSSRPGDGSQPSKWRAVKGRFAAASSLAAASDARHRGGTATPPAQSPSRLMRDSLDGGHQSSSPRPRQEPNSTKDTASMFADVVVYGDRWSAVYPMESCHNEAQQANLHGVKISDLPVPFLVAFKRRQVSGRDPTTIAAELHGGITIFWTARVTPDDSSSLVSVRRVAKTTAVTIGVFPNFNSSAQVKVVMEEGSAVYGAVQHSLLMAVVRENIFEAPLVAPVPPPFYGAPGTPYPEPAPLPERLGPDPATWPKWEVEVMVRRFFSVTELFPDEGGCPSEKSGGPPMAKLNGTNVRVKVQGYRIPAIRVRVEAMGAVLSDTRQWTAASKDTPIISVEDRSLESRAGASSTSAARWLDVRWLLSSTEEAVKQAAAGGHCLAEHSIVRRCPMHVLNGFTSTEDSPGNADDNAPGPSDAEAVLRPPLKGDNPQWDHGDASRNYSRVSSDRTRKQQQPDRAAAEDSLSDPGADPSAPPPHALQDPTPDSPDFSVEYVLQPSSHLCEVTFRNGKFTWPYAKSLDMVWAIVDVYCRIFFAPTCVVHPNPQGPQKWFFVNTVILGSTIFVPVSPLEASDRPKGASCGLDVSFPALRVGYFWGGVGESLLDLDMQDASCKAVIRHPGGGTHQQNDHPLFEPWTVKFTTRWIRPPGPGICNTMVNMRGSPLRASVAFSMVPLLQNAAALLDLPLPGAAEEASGRGTRSSGTDPEAPSETGGSDSCEHPSVQGPGSDEEETVQQKQRQQREAQKRPSLRKAVFAVESIQLVLVDDRQGLNIEVLEASMHRLAGHVGAEEAEGMFQAGEENQTGLALEAGANVGVELEVKFLNSAVNVMEPMVERWPLTCEVRHGDGATSMVIQSDGRININVTPSSFRSIGDARAFFAALSTPSVPLYKPSGRSRGRHSSEDDGAVGALGAGEARDADKQRHGSSSASMYSLRNWSGLRLSYFVSQSNTSYSVAHGEESPLMVEPEHQNIFMPELSQTIRARTICMQLEGAWTPLTSVIVDKVGMYGYEVESRLLRTDDQLPVMMTVEPSARSKILTVHSPFQIRNETSHAVDFVFRVAAGVLRAGVQTALSAPLSSSLPPSVSSNLLQPENYLPVPAGAGGTLKVRAHGYKSADKDVIRVGLQEDVQLQQQQGLITCQGLREESLPFHCCLELKKDVVKMFKTTSANQTGVWGTRGSKAQISSVSTLSHHTLSLVPPIVLENLLPYPIIVDVFEGHNSEEVQCYDIQAGGSISIHTFDMMHKICMKVAMIAPFGLSSIQYSSESTTTIHVPAVSFIDRKRQQDALKEKNETWWLPGLGSLPDARLPRDMKMIATAQLGANLPTRSKRDTTGSAQSYGAMYTGMSKSSFRAGAAAGAGPQHVPNRSTKRTTAFVTSFARQHAIPPLLLVLTNKLNAASGSRRIAVHCPYWIINVAPVTIQLKDGSHKPPTIAAEFQGQAGVLQPVLLGSDKSSVNLATYPGISWSRNIQMDNLGIKGAVSLCEEITSDSDPLEGSNHSQNLEQLDGPKPLPLDIVPYRRVARTHTRMARLATAGRGVIQAGKKWRSLGGSSQRPTVGRRGFRFQNASDLPEDPDMASEAGDPTVNMTEIEMGRSMSSLKAPEESLSSETERNEKRTKAQTMPAMFFGSLPGLRRRDATFAKAPKRYRRFEFVVDVKVAPGAFNLTRIVTISPRFLMLNRTDGNIMFGQLGAPAITLGPGEHRPFIWELADGNQQLRVRPMQSGLDGPSSYVVAWDWSGSFRIDEAGEIGVMVRGLYNPKMNKIINIAISLEGASVLVTFMDGGEHSAPYRIENRSDKVEIDFQQRDTGNLETLKSSGRMRYAWEEPTLPHRLQVRFRLRGNDEICAMREYNLDDIKAHQAVMVAGKHGKDRGAGTQLMLSRPSKSSRERGSAGEAATPGDASQERTPARIYVAVIADGPARVLVFSDTKETFPGDQETEDEKFKALSEKLGALDAEVTAVDRQLENLQSILLDQHGVSLGLALAQFHPQLDAAGARQLEAEGRLPLDSSAASQAVHTRSYSTGVYDHHPSYTTSPPRQPRISPPLNGRISEHGAEASEETSGDSAELLTESLSPTRSSHPRWPTRGIKTYKGLWGRVRQARPSEQDNPEWDLSELGDSGARGISNSFSTAPKSPPSTPLSPTESSTRRLATAGDSANGAADNDQEMDGSLRKGRLGKVSFSLFHRGGSFRKWTGASADGALAAPGGQQSQWDPQSTSSGPQTLQPRQREGSGLFSGVLSKFATSSDSFGEDSELSQAMAQAMDDNPLYSSLGDVQLLPGGGSRGGLQPLPASRSRVHFAENPLSEDNASFLTPVQSRETVQSSSWNGLPPMLLQTLGSDSLKSPRSVFLTHTSSGRRLSIGEDPLAEEVQQYMEDKEGILGGELVVRILCAQDLVDVSRKKSSVRKQKTMTASDDHTETLRWLSVTERSLSASRRSMEALEASGPLPSAGSEPKGSDPGDLKQRKGFFATSELESYVVLECEGQTRQTRLAGKSENPEWDEEVTFKSVQVESELKVTVYGKSSRFRSDLFLGEVIIPLGDIQADVATLDDVLTYDLSRRSRERVSGRIKLSSMWRITPLDVVTLKLKARQTELDDKQEVVALLRDKFSDLLRYTDLGSSSQHGSVRLTMAESAAPDATLDGPSTLKGKMPAMSVLGGLDHVIAATAPSSPMATMSDASGSTAPSLAVSAATTLSMLGAQSEHQRPHHVGVGSSSGTANKSPFTRQTSTSLSASHSLPNLRGEDDAASEVEQPQGNAGAAKDGKGIPGGVAARPWRKIAGQLEVKIISARNLMVPSENSRGTLDCYAVLMCESHSGQQTHQTDVRRDGVGSPVWNDETTFNDVASSDIITARLFDHRKFRMGGDVCLGQARVPVMEFLDCKPQYRWLSLQRRSPKDRAPHGEVHIRVQLRSDDQFQRIQGSYSLQVSLQGIGFTVLEASARELMHCHLEDLNVDYRRTDHEESLRMGLRALQVDNQLLSSQHPVVLSPFVDPKNAHGDGGGAGGAAGGLSNERPVMEVAIVRSLADPSMLYLQYFTVLLQEMNLVLEEEFLDLMIAWGRSLPLEDIFGGGICTGGAAANPAAFDRGLFRDDSHEMSHLSHDSDDEFVMNMVASHEMQALFATLGGAVAKRLSGLASQTQGPSEGKWYFEILHIQPLKINLSILPGSSELRSHQDGSIRLRTASHLGVNLVNINNVPLRINQLALKNAFVRPSALFTQIARHMAFNVLSELYKVLGNVELVGAPVSLISTLGTGVVDFFYEPAKGIVHGPDEFARGVASGTVSLIKNSAYGIFHTVGQVTGGMSKGIAVLSLDRHYMKRFNRRPVSVQEGIRQGAQDLGVGIYEGVTGIVTDPLRGAESSGMRGFFKGLATGLTGVVVKPTAGMLEFASKTVSGIGGGIKAWGDEASTPKMQRVRKPRAYGIASELSDRGQRELIEWQAFLAMMPSADGRFDDDRVTDFLVVGSDRAVVFTHLRMLFVSLTTRRPIWEAKGDNITSAASVGKSLHVTSRGRPRVMGIKTVKGLTLPVRHTIWCSSQDALSSLVYKVASFRTQFISSSGSEGEQDAAPDGVMPSQESISSEAPRVSEAAVPFPRGLEGTSPPGHRLPGSTNSQISLGESNAPASGSKAAFPGPSMSKSQRLEDDNSPSTPQSPGYMNWGSSNPAGPASGDGAMTDRSSRQAFPEMPPQASPATERPESTSGDNWKAIAAQHAASMSVLVQLLALQPREAQAGGGHLQSISALSNAVSAAIDPRDPQAPALQALAASVSSLCSSAPGVHADEAQGSLVLDTLRQLCRSMEELLR